LAYPPITSKTRVFATVWVGQLISGLGTGLTNFALGVWVFLQTGSATKFALIAVFSGLPNIIMLPLVGALIDRRDRRSIMLLGNIGCALTTITGAALLATGRLEVWHIYIGVMLRTIFSSFISSTFAATTALLISKQFLGRASGMVQANTATVQIFAPLLGGFLIALIKLPFVLVFDFVSYVVAIVSLSLVKIPAPGHTPSPSPAPAAAAATVAAPPAAPAKGGFVKENVTFGVNFILARPALLALLTYFAVVNFVIGCTTILFTPMMLSFSSARVLGTVLSVLGAGYLTGSIVMSVWGGPTRRLQGILIFGALFGMCSVVIGLRPSPILIAIGAFAMYFFLPLVNGCTEALWQTKTPPEVQGRVFAVRRIVAASTVPAAFLSGGTLADKVFEPLVRAMASSSAGKLISAGPGRGIGLMFMVGGCLIVLMQVGAYLYSPLRRVEEDLPDAVAELLPSRA
jgi:hypothetical protein